MNLEEVMQELEALGKERTKKIYMSNGAHEPLFGVATGAMKPIARKIKRTRRWPSSCTQPGIMMRCILRVLLLIRKQ